MSRRDGQRVGCVALLLAAVLGCQQKPEEPAEVPVQVSPSDEARRLIEAGQADAALAKLLAGEQTGENLCLQGAAWAKKAETAPLPTPTIATDGTVTTPEFKSEELRAIELFQRALVSDRKLGEAHLGLAEVLAPHAIRRHELAVASRKSRKGRRGASEEAPAAEPLLDPNKISEHFKAAGEDATTALRALDGLARFARRMGRLDDAEWALRGMAEQEPENAEHKVALGDLLLHDRDDSHGAIGQYKQALIWKPDDPEIMGKIADIFIEQGREAFQAEQWAVAEARFVAAQEWVPDRNSPRSLRIRDYRMKLDAIRRTPGRR